MAEQAKNPGKKKQTRRQSIVEAARKRFRTSGLEATTLDMIAADASLPRPHLYRYFKNKADLTAAVVAAEAAEVNQRRYERVSEIDSFVDKLVVGITAAVEIVHSDPFWASLVSPDNVPYTAYVASDDPELTQSNEAFWRPILEAARDQGELRPGIDIGETMTWILGVEFMFLERREFYPNQKSAEHYARTYVVPSVTGHVTNVSI